MPESLFLILNKLVLSQLWQQYIPMVLVIYVCVLV